MTIFGREVQSLNCFEHGSAAAIALNPSSLWERYGIKAYELASRIPDGRILLSSILFYFSE